MSKNGSGVMRKVWILLIVLIVAAAGVGAWLYYANGRFDAERILAGSKLKERAFAGKVEEVSALDGKVTGYLMEEHSVPLVAVSFGFDKAGSAYEEKEGTALLAESVLLDGAGRYTRRELRALMKEKGIKLSVSSGRDRFSFSLSFVKEFYKDALEVLKAVLYEPRLDKEDLEMAVSQLAAARKRQAESPKHELSEMFRDEFFIGHPYGREDIAETEVLAQVTDKDILAFMEARFAKDTLSLGISGDMDRAEAEAFLSQAFAGLSDKSEALDMAPVEVDFYKKEVKKKSQVSAQSFVLFAAEGVKRLDKDFYPLYVADYIFGGSGLSSRLNKAVREKEGLTYGIYSYFSNSDGIDLWQVSFSASVDNAEKAKVAAEEEYKKFYETGVSAEELALAKESLLSAFNLRFSSNIQIAGMLEQMQAQGLGVDFLNKRQETVAAISLDEVNDAILRRLPKSLGATGGVRVLELTGNGRQ